MGKADSGRQKRDARRDKQRYAHKTVRITAGNQSRSVDKWQAKGWEVVALNPGDRRGKLVVRKLRANRHRGWWAVSAGLAILLVAGLFVELTLSPIHGDPGSKDRAAASAAVHALGAGDLAAVEKQLAGNRGNVEFAYYFASQATPRTLGDVLATVAGRGSSAPFKTGVDADEYDLALTDLAGVVSLATHGTGSQSLPESWTSDFVTATTHPEKLYGKADKTSPQPKRLRADQDTANKRNLLLLLSRGNWSTGFLKKVTAAYWTFDHDAGDGAWSGVRLADAKYAPAPNGTYLTDGVLALSAALTANPTASAWAFTEFKPGSTTVTFAGADHTVGRFTHFLFFEHDFAASSSVKDGSSHAGATAALTALASATSANEISNAVETPAGQKTSLSQGPAEDALVLKALADSVTDNSGCTWDPSDYWECTKAVAEVVVRWANSWGHTVLDVLSLLTFVPGPLEAIGVVAAATNAGWYAIDGDYADAGLSLAAAVPGLAFAKIAKTVAAGIAAKSGVKAASRIENAAAKSDGLAARARAWLKKPWNDCSAVPPGLRLVYKSTWTKAQRQAADEKVKTIYEAGQAGKLKKTLTNRAGTSASAKYVSAGGAVPDDNDVDHVIDLQLGGADEVANMKPLDKSVNRSLGIQIAHQLKSMPVGQVVPAAAICEG